MAENKVATTINKVQTFDISNSGGIIELAKDLAKFIKENKLSSNVQGKEFVNVEGWQYAGARMGIVAVIEYAKDISPADGSEIIYEAKATLLNLSTNQIVGAGFATCSNKENGKKYYQQFAIASMAQTRSIGKAYRNILAWIIRAAGYEPTPTEEMDYTTAVVVENKQPDPAKKAAAEKAMQVVDEPAVSMEEAFANADTYKDLMQKEVWSDEEREAGLERLKTLTAPEVVKAIAALRKAIDKRTTKAA